MTNGPYIAEIAALVGDPARANILSALMDGRALSAGELAYLAHVTPQTASAHLAKLVDARLLTDERRGRNRYFRLAAPEVARMLEEIMAVAVARAPRYRPAWMRDEALRSARTCYDHLAGRLGVALAGSLAERGHVLLDDDGGEVTEDGARFLTGFGLDLAGAAGKRRRFCRPCLDWSERRPHLGGAVGAALAQRCFALGWIERVKNSRAVAITPTGSGGFSIDLGLDSPQPARQSPADTRYRCAIGLSPRRLRRAPPSDWMRRVTGFRRSDDRFLTAFGLAEKASATPHLFLLACLLPCDLVRSWRNVGGRAKDRTGDR
jgi:DNA-binding transcriptional ArsR family regulator